MSLSQWIQTTPIPSQVSNLRAFYQDKVNQCQAEINRLTARSAFIDARVSALGSAATTLGTAVTAWALGPDNAGYASQLHDAVNASIEITALGTAKTAVQAKITEYQSDLTSLQNLLANS